MYCRFGNDDFEEIDTIGKRTITDVRIHLLCCIRIVLYMYMYCIMYTCTCIVLYIHVCMYHIHIIHVHSVRVKD